MKNGKINYISSESKIEYNRRYREERKRQKEKRKAGKPPKPYNTIEDKYLIDRHKTTPLVVEPTGTNFKGTVEPIVCSHFGCATHLSLEERRFGTKCIHHQERKKINPNSVLSYPVKKIA